MEKSTILPRSFYDQKTEKVARDLLGKYLVRGKNKFKITETEAYLGPHDLAAHSRFGKTKRTAVMFGPAGHAYVYLIYGMYHCLNIVTRDEGSAVLIRGVTGINGPGKVCRELDITKKLNGLDITKKGELYIVDNIIATPRIGVGYAKEWKDKPLRFVLT